VLRAKLLLRWRAASYRAGRVRQAMDQLQRQRLRAARASGGPCASAFRTFLEDELRVASSFPFIRRSRMNRHLGFSQFKYRAILRSLLEGRVQLARRPATVNTVDIRTPRTARFFGIPARVAIPRQALPTWPGIGTAKYYCQPAPSLVLCVYVGLPPEERAHGLLLSVLYAYVFWRGEAEHLASQS
jgi:hypothetical protein